MGHKRCWALAALILMLPLTANAQNLVRAHSKGLFGFNGSVARPTGEFLDYVEWGGGLGLHGVVNFDRRNQIGLRIGTSLVVYGHESYPTQISPSIGRIWVDVNTDNFIVDFGVGPQIVIPGGMVRAAKIGRDQHRFLPVRDADQREGVRSPAPSANRRQRDHRQAGQDARQRVAAL